MERYSSLGICLERGDTLPKALEISSKPLESAFIDVSGFGELAWVDLSNHAEGDKPMRFEGPLQLLDLKGRIRRAGAMVISDFVCTISRQTDNGISVIGGKLIKAGVNHLEITYTPLESSDSTKPDSKPEVTESTERRTPEATPPKPAAPPPEPDEKFVSVKSKAVEKTERSAPADDRWAKAVAEARRLEEEKYLYEHADVRPKLGDKVNHRQFGECTVARIDDDHITLRKPDGRNVQLGLQILVFTRVGYKDNKDVFDVQVGSRR